MNFEPFIDYEAISKEMSNDIHEHLKAHRKAADDFLKGDPNDVEACARVLQAAEAMEMTYRKVADSLYTVPVMVHVAGPKKPESNPNDPTQEGVFQRCSRCGSVLSWWHEQMGIFDPEVGPRMMEEDEVPWWEEGNIVAKTSTEHGSMGMYLIEPDHTLEKHELECVSLSELVGDTE